jgi:hypothetical protein
MIDLSELMMMQGLILVQVQAEEKGQLRYRQCDSTLQLELEVAKLVRCYNNAGIRRDVYREVQVE